MIFFAFFCRNLEFQERYLPADLTYLNVHQHKIVSRYTALHNFKLV